jgi:hypothetical protein
LRSYTNDVTLPNMNAIPSVRQLCEPQLRTKLSFEDKTLCNSLTLREIGRGGGDRTHDLRLKRRFQAISRNIPQVLSTSRFLDLEMPASQSGIPREAASCYNFHYRSGLVPWIEENAGEGNASARN